jgi:hypothetical protein
MKKILNISVLLILVFASTTGFAQKKLFVRVFDQAGRKINKGYYISSTDSSITLIRNKKESVIPVTKIQTIKLKRSFGAGVWKGSLIGGSVFTGFGAVSAEPEAIPPVLPGQAAVVGLIGGAAVGGAIGGIIDAVKKRPSFDIQQDPEKWKNAREIVETYLQ